MNVVNICGFDNANFSHDNANALRSVGVNCSDYVLQKHPFNYESQSIKIDKSMIWELCHDADVIQIMHSDLRLFNLCPQLRKKTLVVWNTGTIYRQNPKEFNNFFNPIVKATFNALGEFDGLGQTNPYYFVGAIDTDKLQPVYNHGKIIGHYPSNPQVKGTTKIIEFCRYLGLPLDYTTSRVDYEIQLKRMAGCDIYLELFNLQQEGRKYGSWGITALEAACLGKAVITNHTSLSVYLRTYGNIGITIANTEDDFKKAIKEVYNGDTHAFGRMAREWVVMNHSYKASGNRLKEILSGL